MEKFKVTSSVVVRVRREKGRSRGCVIEGASPPSPKRGAEREQVEISLSTKNGGEKENG